jgi:hypothetical protein
MLRKNTKSPDKNPDKSMDKSPPQFVKFDLLCLACRFLDIKKKRLLKEPDSAMTPKSIFPLASLLLLVVSVAPSNAQVFTNTQSTTCTGNNNTGCTTTVNGRVAPARTITRTVRTQVPLKSLIFNRSTRR